ncbi:hypothetical protein IVA96_30325 [Bradyrhizobium sp. 159]|uniref:hypothetical protein n=1 Tax=Bradyrhizobium sp. 159 TaxID=2782632 RepID=UPI001FFBB5A4|nr:hypothetical protein [Bradyrhizobium sp. 159]MCK1620793.1 hypothetical protein [Bradyrhizobium sp. 159]
MTVRKSRNWFDKATFTASAAAAVAALAAAIFTGWQAWIAKDTENRQLRAYLFIDHSSLSEIAPGKFTTDLAIRAAGVTPAYKLKLAATFEIGPYLLNETKLSDQVGGNTQTFDYAVAYGTKEINQQVSMQFVPEAVKLLQGDAQRLYLHGNIRYSDMFGAEHQYDFCFVFHPTRDSLGSERGCEQYNQPR